MIYAHKDLIFVSLKKKKDLIFVHVVVVECIYIGCDEAGMQTNVCCFRLALARIIAARRQPRGWGSSTSVKRGRALNAMTEPEDSNTSSLPLFFLFLGRSTPQASTGAVTKGGRDV